MEERFTEEARDYGEEIKELQDFVSSLKFEIGSKDRDIEAWALFSVLTAIVLSLAIFSLSLLVIYKL